MEYKLYLNESCLNETIFSSLSLTALSSMSFLDLWLNLHGNIAGYKHGTCPNYSSTLFSIHQYPGLTICLADFFSHFHSSSSPLPLLGSRARTFAQGHFNGLSIRPLGSHFLSTSSLYQGQINLSE